MDLYTVKNQWIEEMVKSFGLYRGGHGVKPRRLHKKFVVRQPNLWGGTRGGLRACHLSPPHWSILRPIKMSYVSTLTNQPPLDTWQVLTRCWPILTLNSHLPRQQYGLLIVQSLCIFLISLVWKSGQWALSSSYELHFEWNELHWDHFFKADTVI